MTRRPPPISRLIALAVVVPLITVSAALLFLTSLTAHRISEDLGAGLLDGAAESAGRDSAAYLAAAVRTSDLFERRARAGSLPAAGLAAWEPVMLETLLAEPDVASICFANPAGDCTWLLRNAGRLEVGRASGTDAHRAVELVMHPDGSTDPEPIRTYTYDPRERPWYKLAIAAPRPLWTPVYFWFGAAGADSTTGAGYTRTIRDASGQVLGVLVIDITLSRTGDFLRSLPLASRGAIFILDDQDLLVAASDSAVNSADGQRLRLDASSSPAARAAARTLAEAHPADSLRAHIDRRPARVKVTALAPYPGVAWRIITVLPEDQFLAEARAVQRRAVLLAVVAAAGCLALGVLLARRLSAPVVRLTEHVRLVGAGDFDRRLSLRAARELEELSEAVNRMAGDLKQRLELQKSLEVAMEVQQSLLPAADPVSDRFDIAGRTRYCDATGGDYYDFIDVAAAAKGSILVALGDVMGHGIAAALLMASARAALRSQAAEQNDLASVLTKVNRVLTRDNRHGRFMTMSLIILEPSPSGATARWASAGHDPALLYNPAADRFDELAEGGLPLGIEESAEYDSYQRDDLPPGSVLLIGTDGIWEMPGPDKSRFGKDRLKAFIRDHRGESAAGIAMALEETLNQFRADTPAEDDVTFVIIKVRAPLAEITSSPAASR